MHWLDLFFSYLGSSIWVFGLPLEFLSTSKGLSTWKNILDLLCFILPTLIRCNAHYLAFEESFKNQAPALPGWKLSLLSNLHLV